MNPYPLLEAEIEEAALFLESTVTASEQEEPVLSEEAPET